MLKTTLSSHFQRLAVRSAYLAAALLVVAAAASAQPYGRVLSLHGPASEYIEIPHADALNPSSAFTFEAWVRMRDANGTGGCSSIAGKDFRSSWWIGICGTTLRSYLKGSDSAREGGELSSSKIHQIAVVFTGTRRLHYVDGELTGDFPETGPLPGNTAPLRIGSDVSWEHTPDGYIDNARLWNVARTQAQIRADRQGLSASPAAASGEKLLLPPGLVGYWQFDGDATDVANGHHGTPHGAVAYGVPGTSTESCAPLVASNYLCLYDRFAIRAFFRTGPQGSEETPARVVSAANPGSGLFWFFASDNWEVMVKVIDACSLNNRFWVFSAATTNVFYRLEVVDLRTGYQRIYFNHPGPPAPAVTDTDALVVCS